MKRGHRMSITYYSHTDGIKLLAKMLYDEKLTPIIGAGFTRNCSSKKATVPDGNQATEIMKKMINEIRQINLSSADFNKISERFFSIVPKEKQWVFLRPILHKLHFLSIYLLSLRYHGHIFIH